jgi:glycine/D-amino acid oxidase-like deaminating enzyme
MTTPPPIVVLGGGLMGLAIAHQLARRGHAVRVISRNRMKPQASWRRECWHPTQKD